MHNLQYLIPNTRKERAKSLPRNWPRVDPTGALELAPLQLFT